MGNPVLLNSNDYVRVTNDGPETIEGRYNGVDYTFRSGEYVDVPLMVATHIFGFAGDERAKSAAFLRLGWLQAGYDLKGAAKKMDSIRFEDLPNVIELVQRPKISRAGPLVAGGTEGAAMGALPPPPAPEDPLAIDNEIDEPVIGERI